jgi:hypothetical protein
VREGIGPEGIRTRTVAIERTVVQVVLG